VNFIAGWKKDWICDGSTWANAATQIFHAALDKPIDTGKNNESMQVFRSAAMSRLLFESC
jgi:hypothetical protein